MAEQNKPQAAVERIDMLTLKSEQEVLSALMAGKCDLEQASNRLVSLKQEAIKIAKTPRISDIKLEGDTKDGWLIVRIPLHEPTLSSQEKTYVCGSTGGQRRTEFTVNTPSGERKLRVTAMALAYREEKGN